MKLIIGLGNPGEQYAQTWHNIGFIVLDSLRTTGVDEFGSFRENKKFSALVCQGSNPEGKIILAKPQTFMNRSGVAVKALASFYKVPPEDIWVLHDDVDIALGKIRISLNASSAGHKGVQSIIDELGSQNFVRFRLGIKQDPPSPAPTEEYVLQKIDTKSKVLVDEVVQAVLGAIEVTLTRGITEAMNDFN